MNTPTLIHHLAELLAKSVLVLGPMLLLAALLRRRSAALRHTLLLAAFVTLLLLPLGKLVAPHWRLSELVAAHPPPAEIPSIVAFTGIPVPADPAPEARPAKFSWPEPSRLMIGFWLAGVAMLLGFRAFGSWQIAVLKRNCTKPAGNRFSTLAATVARELSCLARPEIRFSDATRVPCTWGVRRAVVLLPAEAAQWSEAHLIAALRHEFAHVARRDYLTRWLSYTVCALYWPNPLVWFAARELYASQEQACDDLVLQAGTPSADYATLLFETARACTGAPVGWRNAIAMARPSTLQNRVVAVVDETRDRRPASRLAKLLGGFGVAGVVGMSAMAQVAEVKPAEPAGAAAPLQQVEISAKFIEAPKGKFAAAQIDAALEPPNWGNLLSAPRLTVRSGQRGMIQIGEERPLPPGSEPKTQFVGTSLEVLPVVADGKIQLRCSAEIVSVSGEDPATKQPVFTHRNSTTNFTIASGGKAIMATMASEKPGQEITVLIEAKVLSPAELKEFNEAKPLPPAAGENGVEPQPRAAPAKPAIPGTLGDPATKPTESEAKPGPTEVAAPGALKLYVKVSADQSHTKPMGGEEGDVTTASGHVHFTCGTTTITADSMRYAHGNHRGEFRGNVEMQTEGGTMRGETVSVEFAEDGRIFIGEAGSATSIFLSAYMSFQQGEKAEATGKIETGIKNFNQAISLLDQVSQRWPTWNPAIVKHRRDRAAEALGKLQAKGSAGRPDGDPLNGASLPASKVPGAKVLAYNPSWNFVVLSIGDTSGLKAGANMVVQRGNTMIAKLKVTKVEPDTAIADVLPDSVGSGKVEPGDTVIFEGTR